MSGDWLGLVEAGGYGLFYVHIDERGDSVTLGFEKVEEAEGFEFYVVFAGVRRLMVTGWGAEEAQDVRVSVREDEDEGFDVVLGAPRSGIAFRAAAARLAKSRTYPAGGC
ncbi:Imm50 family immunity protein [Streptomyces sp. NPDC054834]